MSSERAKEIEEEKEDRKADITGFELTFPPPRNHWNENGKTKHEVSQNATSPQSMAGTIDNFFFTTLEFFSLSHYLLISS